MNSRLYSPAKDKIAPMFNLRIAKLIGVTVTALFTLSVEASKKTATLKLSGTRGAAFEGTYKVGDVVSTVSGKLPTRFKLENANLDGWEFRKLDRTANLRVTTYHGCRRGLRVNSKPGTLGARLDSVGGRHFEIFE